MILPVRERFYISFDNKRKGEDGDAQDFVIRTTDEEFHVHSEILKNHCEFFKTMFHQDFQWQVGPTKMPMDQFFVHNLTQYEQEAGKLVVDLSQFDSHILDMVVDFAYNDMIELDDNVTEALQFARLFVATKFLGVPKLVALSAAGFNKRFMKEVFDTQDLIDIIQQVYETAGHESIILRKEVLEQLCGSNLTKLLDISAFRVQLQKADGLAFDIINHLRNPKQLGPYGIVNGELAEEPTLLKRQLRTASNDKFLRDRLDMGMNVDLDN